MEGKNEAITKLNKMKPRLATIDLNWLDGEIENLNITIEELIEKKLKEEMLSTVLVIDSRITLLSHELLVLHNLRKKCTTIEEPKETFLSKTCINNWEDKKFCENNGKCEMCKIK